MFRLKHYLPYTILVLAGALSVYFLVVALRWDSYLQGLILGDGETWWITHGDLARLDAIRGYVKAIAQIIVTYGISFVLIMIAKIQKIQGRDKSI
jgi:hypothetical protein